MRWIKEHKLISILVGAIIFVFVLIMVSIGTGGKGNIVTGGTNSALSFLETPFASVGRSISKQISGMFSYQDLMKENDKLKDENTKLKRQVVNLTLTDNQLRELERLSKSLNYVGNIGDKEIVSADIISLDGTNWMNIFTINSGKEKGIKVGNTVVSGEGLVGRVMEVGTNWAKVKTITDENNNVSFKLTGNLGIIGIIDSIDDGKLQGFMLDSNSTVSKGEKLITSGMGVYPEGIDIGSITKTKYDKDRQLQIVTVKPAVNFKSLQKVVVIL